MRNVVSDIHVMNVYYVVKYAIVLMIINYLQTMTSGFRAFA